MNLKSIVRDGLGSISRMSFDPWRRERERATMPISFKDGCEGEGDGGEGRWTGLPPELLREVAKKMEQSESLWPARRNIVVFASVCRSWRHVSKEVVGVPETTGKLTFPLSLKQPGPRSAPIQCYIKRNKATSTYQLFLGLNPENGKFLLAARRIRRPTHAEYIISMVSEDISCNSVGYIGKLRSNFLGTKFAIYDSQPPYSGAVSSNCRSHRRLYSRKVSPKVPSGSYFIAHIVYELNMLSTRGPRRMCCTMDSIPTSSIEPNGTVTPYYNAVAQSLEESFSSISLPPLLVDAIGDVKSSDSARFTGNTKFAKVSMGVIGKEDPLILKNKSPRWHDQLQCWCLNFHGRVTVASVKNFQLVAASGEPEDETTAGSSQTGSRDRDKTILQFGKIGKDLFTMDYRYPLSAFQAFGICLSSFDTKLASR